MVADAASKPVALGFEIWGGRLGNRGARPLDLSCP